MADKGKLRTTLSPTEVLLTALMPASQVAAIMLLWQVRSGTQDVRQVAGGLAAFYALWAVKNRLTTQPHERGHFALGLTAVGCHYALGGGSHAAAFFGAVMTWATFAFAATKVLTWPAHKLAHVMKKTALWARVLQLYYVSSLATWAAAAYFLFVRYRLEA